MCGLGGILRRDGGEIPDAWLDLIDQRIAHRGPDGHGRFRDRATLATGQGERTVEVALVHRRLSIIDHDGGTQPMVSERGRDGHEGPVAVVFNGCIYNHRQLRDELESVGRVFSTDHSDTEVLIHGYREWGEGLTEHLEGMYAFALWDRGRASLMLSRDWFGEKPLYVRIGVGGSAETIAFASDAAALALLGGSVAGSGSPGRPRRPRRPRRRAEQEHRHEGTNEPRTRSLLSLRGLRGDCPASAAWTRTYLQLGYNWRSRTIYLGSPEAVLGIEPTIRAKINTLMPRRPRETHSQRRIEALIAQAVASRLEADVPLGCFLSGGVDSSLIAHFAREHKPDLRTFTVRMPDPRYDESAHAESVAEHLGVAHTTLDVAAHPAEDLVHLITVLGQPFGDSSVLPTYWVSKAARQHVKVALSGDGGDEMFIGYHRYMAARHLWRHRRLLQWMPRGFGRRAHPTSWKHRIGRLGEMARDARLLGILSMESIFPQHLIYDLLDGLPGDPAAQPPGGDPMQALRRIDLLSYLPDDLLLKVDTASMAVALEVRCPYLDRDLARAVLAAPTWQLAPGGRRKGLLREIARKYLPADVVDRPKMGFAIPIGEWFRNDFGSMRSLLLGHIGPEALRDRPFGPVTLQPQAVTRLVDEHLSEQADHGQRLFALLTLAIWARSIV